MDKYIDLHTHTTASDGSMTPEQLVYYAKKKGLTALAITDHDTINGVKNALIEGEKEGVEVIPGIELSADFENMEMHLLGYYIDIKSGYLKNYLKKLRQFRMERNEKIVNKLKNIGMDITIEEVKHKAKGDIIGRVHISRIMIEKGYVKNIREAFDKYLGNGKIAYVGRTKLSPKETVKLIKKSGGIAVLAHPVFLEKNIYELDNIINNLKQSGLNGIEAYYPNYSKQQHESYMYLAKKYNLIVTGGSDFHGNNRPNVQLGKVQDNMRIPYEILENIKNITN